MLPTTMICRNIRNFIRNTLISTGKAPSVMCKRRGETGFRKGGGGPDNC